MKIVQVCPGYHPKVGGNETHVKEISERLAKRDFQVEVLTTDPLGNLPKAEVINEVRVRRFKSWAPNEAYYFSMTLKKFLMKNTDVALIHAHNYGAFPALYAIRAKNKNMFVFTPHYHEKGHSLVRSLLRIPYKLVGKQIFRRADKIVCVSNHEQRLLTRHFRVKSEKLVVIPNGVDLDSFRDLEKPSKDCSAILYVGRLEKYKGVHYLIKALPMVNNDVTLNIVGKGPYKKTLVKLARKVGVKERVSFLQNLSKKDLLQEYSKASALVLLSKYEAYGMSVAEALAAKTPCILAKTSALNEWIDNENCFGIDYPINLDKLAGLIDKLVEEKASVHMHTRMELIDWSVVVDKLVGLYMSYATH